MPPSPFRSLIRSLILILSLCSLATLAAAEGTAAVSEGGSMKRHRVYHTVRLEGKAPAIDGKLDDACWQNQGVWMTDYEQWSPTHGGKATEKTDIKVLYDDTNLYVAIRAHEPDTSRISRNAGDRDEFTGDIVGVTFDSHHDLLTAYEFDLTAAGQKLDLKLAKDNWDTTWNAVWEGKVSTEDKAWTAEFLIPLSQLRYNPTNTTWGMHSWRWIDRIKEESDWNLLPNDNSGFAKGFGEIQGLKDLKSVRRIELTPYASTKYETFGQRQGTVSGASGKTTVSGGLDAKIGLSSSLTLDASILPDFGQVESDPSVMNLSAFETFMEERRPLFIEGKDIFEFKFDKDQIFYSRRIGQAPGIKPNNLSSRMPETSTLLGAVKLSGRTANGWSLGVLGSVTDEETASVTENGLSRTVAVEPRTSYFIARTQKEFRDGDTVVGGILTLANRELSSDLLRANKADTATVLGFDLTHYWSAREFYLKCIAVGTRVEGDRSAISQLQRSSSRYYQRPVDGSSHYDATRTELDGTGLLLEAGKGSRGKWRYSGQLVMKSPGLEYNDLGYISTADLTRQKAWVSYFEKKPSSWYRNFSHTLTQANSWTSRGEYLNSYLEEEGNYEFTNKWQISTDIVYTGEGYDPVTLRGGPMMRVPANFYTGIYFNTDSSKSVYVEGNWYESHSSNNAWASRDLALKLNYRPIPALLLSVKVSSSHQRDMLRQIDLSGTGAANSWFVSRLDGDALSYALRAQWIIRPELRLQYYGNPFGSTLRYSDYRRVLDPLAASYGARTGSLPSPSFSNGTYSFDENRDGITDLTRSDPDGNTCSFRSNLVLKWEYRRGSMLYFVWSQQREDSYKQSSANSSTALSHLQNIAPNNQFMVKATYWFNL